MRLGDCITKTVCHATDRFRAEDGRWAHGGFDGSKSFKDTLGSAEPGTQFQVVLQVSSIRQYIEGLLTGESKQRYDTDVKPWLDPFSAAAVRVRKDGSVTKFEVKATVK